jgi:hypothetical protein
MTKEASPFSRGLLLHSWPATARFVFLHPQRLVAITLPYMAIEIFRVLAFLPAPCARLDRTVCPALLKAVNATQRRAPSHVKHAELGRYPGYEHWA